MFFFNVLLTVHFSITLVNDQLVAQFFYFIIRLLQSSTCFEQRSVLIIRRSNLLIQHLVSSLTDSDDTRCCINKILRPHDEHDVAGNM